MRANTSNYPRQTYNRNCTSANYRYIHICATVSKRCTLPRELPINLNHHHICIVLGCQRVVILTNDTGYKRSNISLLTNVRKSHVGFLYGAQEIPMTPYIESCLFSSAFVTCALSSRYVSWQDAIHACSRLSSLSPLWLRMNEQNDKTIFTVNVA